MKTAIAFLTKDRVHLSKQTCPVLIDGARKNLFRLFWCDGSATEEGEQFALDAGYPTAAVESNVRGGPDAAVAYALTTMLNHKEKYEYIGLVENDVLLPAGWFGPTMALFERGNAEGLAVGAVSARCYEDRILCQRDGYALMHNLGFGMTIMTREAARLALRYLRTSLTIENRRLFMQLSGLDIARWWAFRGDVHPITADWGVERVLAAHGYAALALTPCDVEMVGQEPELEQQGLTLAREPVELLRADDGFARFSESTADIRDGRMRVADQAFQPTPDGFIVFPHQVHMFYGRYTDDWRLKWVQGFGPWGWESRHGSDPIGMKEYNTPTVQGQWGLLQKPVELVVPISGPCSVFVSATQPGAKMRVVDEASRYECAPELAVDQIVSLSVPASVSHRKIVITALTPGAVFCGIQVSEPQVRGPQAMFDHSVLPPV